MDMSLLLKNLEIIIMQSCTKILVHSVHDQIEWCNGINFEVNQEGWERWDTLELNLAWSRSLIQWW